MKYGHSVDDENLLLWLAYKHTSFRNQRMYRATHQHAHIRLLTPILISNFKEKEKRKKEKTNLDLCVCGNPRYNLSK